MRKERERGRGERDSDLDREGEKTSRVLPLHCSYAK